MNNAVTRQPTGDRFKDAFYLCRAVRESMGPEGIPRILDQFDEGDKEPPGVGPVNNEALKEDTSYLLLDVLTSCLSEEVKEDARKVMCVIVRVS